MQRSLGGIVPRARPLSSARPTARLHCQAQATGGQHQIRYAVDLARSPGPYRVEIRLLYQPVGYRWANNLKSYSAAPEPARFAEYYESARIQSAVVLTSANRIGTCCGE